MNAAACEHGMRRALALAAKGRGAVEPNPLVGAVVLDPAGAVAGEGWHQNFGGPHAEVYAFAQAGAKARGGTLVVTLEPCCHHGKTPPCTDAVLKSGVRRVVVAMHDPFPKVAGGGVRFLRDTGLDVSVGLCEAEARRLNAPYLTLLGAGRPWVHAKWAMSLDGKIATATGDSKWISGEESRARTHELRACQDAILVGRGTVVADDPLLTARPAGPRVLSRVVVTASGSLPERCQLRATAGRWPVILYTRAEGVARLSGWAADGAEIVPVHGESMLPAVLADLGRRRFTNVLVEGGAGLLGSVLDAGLADEFHSFVAPRVIGGAGAASPVGGAGATRIADALRLDRVSVEQLGGDVYVHGFAPGRE